MAHLCSRASVSRGSGEVDARESRGGRCKAAVIDGFGFGFGHGQSGANPLMTDTGVTLARTLPPIVCVMLVAAIPETLFVICCALLFRWMRWLVRCLGRCSPSPWGLRKVTTWPTGLLPSLPNRGEMSSARLVGFPVRRLESFLSSVSAIVLRVRCTSA